jgi:cytosine/adenosine deaminase-related metal-dependent hydrolase
VIIRAAAMLAPTFAVVENPWLRLAGDRIVEITTNQPLTGESCQDLGDVLLMPGLVNAHTHLELGFAQGAVAPGPDFTDWLGRLLAAIRSASDDPARIETAITAGLAASLRAGTTTLGDITRDPEMTRALIARTDPRPTVVSYGEVIAVGRLRERAGPLIAAARSPAPASDIIVGLSPHAPYTVEPEVLSQCGQAARADGLPLCMHAAETGDEAAFTAHGSGRLREHLERLKVWDDRVPIAGTRPIELLARCGLLGPKTLLAHANYVDADDIARLAQSGTSVAYCPRTHAAFEHPPHPVAALLSAGVNVCLGTDSLASNPSLSILDEVRFLHAGRPEITPEMLLRMATGNGARALGLADQIGNLQEGRRADLVAIPLQCNAPRTAVEDVLAGDAEPTHVILGGRSV